MGCTSCTGTWTRRRSFLAPRRRGSIGMPGAGEVCPLPSRPSEPKAGGCGCHGACGSPACALPGAGELEAPAVGSDRRVRANYGQGHQAQRQTDAARAYAALMGRGAGLTPVTTTPPDGRDVTEEEVSTNPQARARFNAMNEAKRAAIARATAQQAGADEAQTDAAIAAAIRGGLDALNSYLRGTFNVQVATINSARDITIARINAESAERLRLLLNPNGTLAANQNPSATTQTVQTVATVGVVALILREVLKG